MASPTVVGTPLTQAFALSTAHNVTMPATITAGQLILVGIAARKQSITASTPDTPAGWSLLGTIQNASNNILTLSVFGKVAVGDEDGTNVDFATPAANHTVTAHTYLIDDWGGTLITDVDVAFSSSGSTTTPNPPLVVAGWGSDDNLYIAFAAQVDNNTFSAAPTNYTDLLQIAHVDNVNLGSARRDLAADQDDPGTFTASGGDAANTGTLVIKPAIFVTPVSNEISFLWDDHSLVNDELSMLWDIRSVVNDTTQLVWDLATVIGDPLTLAWDVRNAISDEVGLKWGINRIINDGMELIWDVLVPISDTCSLVWDTRILANDDCSLQWDIRGAIGDPCNLVWDTLSVVDDELGILWDVAQNGAVGDDVNLHWDVKVNTSDILNAVWDVRVLVTDQVEARWDVRAGLGDTTQFIWDVRTPIGDLISFLWDVGILPVTAIGNEVSLVWGQQAVLGDQIALLWDLVAHVGDPLILVWDISMNSVIVRLIESRIYQSPLARSYGATRRGYAAAIRTYDDE